MVLTNTYAECLRDIGLEWDARKVAHSISEYSTYQRICKTMAGEEISRAYTFGNDPKRHVCPGLRVFISIHVIDILIRVIMPKRVPVR